MIQHLSNSNFNETIENNKVVLVDFYADWCGPCQAFHPTLESLANEFEDRAIISKINVDNNPELSHKFEVRSIPSVFLFKNGKLINKYVGLQSKDLLRQNIDKLLS